MAIQDVSPHLMIQIILQKRDGAGDQGQHAARCAVDKAGIAGRHGGLRGWGRGTAGAGVGAGSRGWVGAGGCGRRAAGGTGAGSSGHGSHGGHGGSSGGGGARGARAGADAGAGGASGASGGLGSGGLGGWGGSRGAGSGRLRSTVDGKAGQEVVVVRVIIRDDLDSVPVPIHIRGDGPGVATVVGDIRCPMG